MSGGKSGFLMSTKYKGFTSASEGTAPAGWLMWSGSSALKIGADTYEGVGLELIANSESFFRYRSTPSEVIIRTDKFFLGNPNSIFISGSDGNIEISSSNFVLTPAGDITASNALFDGDVSAVNFSEKIVTIDDANSGSFLITNGTGKDIVFDGSLGGDVMMNCVIDVSEGFIIKDVRVPNTGSTSYNDVEIIIRTEGMQFDDSTIGSSTSEAYPPKESA
jgi:hypothetical protein